MSFSHIEEAPPDAILGISEAFVADPSPHKLNLSIGAYRTDEGHSKILDVVEAAERHLASTMPHKDYLPIHGHAGFRASAAKVIFGDGSEAISQGRIASFQSVGGTGSLRLAAEFVAKFLKVPVVLVSWPTWGNHMAIFGNAGHTVDKYPYFDARSNSLDFEGYTEKLRSSPDGAAIVLHACAHNPTGVDPSKEQWKEIASIVKAKGMMPIFDSAYQGFADGDLNEDAWAMRYFSNVFPDMIVCQSFSKNLGLYGERLGCLHIQCASAAHVVPVTTQVKKIIRAMYSNPPIHPALLAHYVMSSPELRVQWQAELTFICKRLKRMRKLLREALESNGTPGDWSHITSQIGMFTFTGLTPGQVKEMTSRFHIYMLGNGRINVAGLKPQDCAYVADAIHAVVTKSTL